MIRTEENPTADSGEAVEVTEATKAEPESPPIKYRVAILRTDPGVNRTKGWTWLADPLNTNVPYECELIGLAECRAADFIASRWGQARVVTLRPHDCPRGILAAWDRTRERG